MTRIIKSIHVQLLGRTIDMRSLIAQRMDKTFRENLDFLYDRFESQDICAIVELENLVNILKYTHQLLSKDLILHPFMLILNEIQENISLVSYSSRLAYQLCTEMQSDFLPNFILCNTKQLLVRAPKVSVVLVQMPSVPYVKANFYCGKQVRYQILNDEESTPPLVPTFDGPITRSRSKELRQELETFMTHALLHDEEDKSKVKALTLMVNVTYV
ncbi:hypothetical protein V2J09_013041 [Rumex salicifolius]